MNPNHRILFAGDPHGNFQPLIDAVRKYRPEAVVLLGDYDLERPLECYLEAIIGLTEVFWIAGNHDFQSPGKYHNLFHSSLAGNGLHLRVQEIAGFRIAGLGGIFLGRVWYPPAKPKWINKRHFLNSQKPGLHAGSLSLKYQSAIWHDEFETLKALKADILVTHEAPSSHRFGFAAIGDLAAAMGAKNIFHGHLHENYSCTIRRNIRVVGVADQTVSDLAGNLVSAGELVF
ncbi:MAG: metallophosphoesterase family protein [Gammaproteobacteria bacterium]